MTPEDRELLQGLRRQHLELQEALALLNAKMEDLEARVGVTAEEPPQIPPVLPPLPPLPPQVEPPHFLPPLPIAQEPPIAHLPPVPPPVREPKPSLEFHFGRWLTRLGAVFGVIALALIFSWAHSRIFSLLGPHGW